MTNNLNNIYHNTDYNPSKSRKSLNFFWIFDFLFIFGILALLIYFLFFSSIFTINKIKVSGIENLKTANFTKEIEKISLNKNIFLFNSRKLQADILDQYPEISNLYINKDLPSVLAVNIQERNLAFVWIWQGKNYLVDDLGIVYEQSSESSGILVEVETQAKNSNIQIGNQYFALREVGFIKEIKKNFSRISHLKIQKLIFEEEIFEIRVITDKFMVIFNTARDFNEQLKALELAVSQTKAGEIQEYLDLRVPGKVFYK